MTVILGLDLGTNSVGSAWVDTEKQEVTPGVSVFPAGVEDSDDKRGAPKNQARRGKRSLRRTLARRSQRKRELRRILTNAELLPKDPGELRSLFACDPWILRQKGLDKCLTPHEFGRVLVHLGQRRGALGMKIDDVENEKEKKKPDPESDDAKNNKEKIENTNQAKDDESKVKDARNKTKALMKEVGARTFGELMTKEARKRMDNSRDSEGKPRYYEKGKKKGEKIEFPGKSIRNRMSSFEFHADRAMIREEFELLWKRQSDPGGALVDLNSKDREGLKQQLDNPKRNGIWRHQGAIFGQRNIYWDTGTLGRCDLEPTDRCIAIADRHASYYRVLETVNNIRLRGPYDEEKRSLTEEERAKVIDRLRAQKTGSVAAVRAALGIDKRSLKKQDLSPEDWWISLEHDEDREINTDWFHREIVCRTVGEEVWDHWSDAMQEGLNRAVLKCDPTLDEDADRLRQIAEKIGLEKSQVDELIEGWKTRPKLEKRLSISRQSVQKLLPYMQDCFTDARRDKTDPRISVYRMADDGYDSLQHRWLTQIEARAAYAREKRDEFEQTGDYALRQESERYALGGAPLTKAERHYIRKHPHELIPPPMLSNPVVRKAIYEVRRHIMAHMQKQGGRKPDQIVIEFMRETTKSEKESDRILNLNRKRSKIRKKITDEIVKPAFGDQFHKLSHNQLKEAVDRVVLARQQRGHCPYCQHPICEQTNCTDFVAAKGESFEIDHIIPKSRCGINSWNNKVLAHARCNQKKSKQTPREWWGEQFDEYAQPMAFMGKHKPSGPNEYFTKRDYADKWDLFSRWDVPKQWRGSQLTDTAYAARQVQEYLHKALWPNEPTHLQGGKRRIFVTKGAYTARLRKEWQLYQTSVDLRHDSREAVQNASAKNRGDHREHAVDAVAIALTNSDRIQELARDDDSGRRRLDPPWGSVESFREQVIHQVYAAQDSLPILLADKPSQSASSFVVSHRSSGRKITGELHEASLFSPVPDSPNTYVGRLLGGVANLTPNHLRPPNPEKPEDSIARLAQEYQDAGVGKSKAKKRAKALVESDRFTPPMVDPPPGKSGLVRDLALRLRIRECIAGYEYVEKDREGNIQKRYKLDPDSFSKKEIKQAYDEKAICHKSRVPIKRVRLLRTMKDPVVTHRKKWNHQRQQWERDTGKASDLALDERSKADRAYVGGNNHHIEIRADADGEWSGTIVPMFDAAKRTRQSLDPVDRSDDPTKGGAFIMSLSEGEMVYCREWEPKKGKVLGKAIGPPTYWVVFKLDKPHTIQFKHHWDARRAKGEKDEDGNLIVGSKREPMPISVSDFIKLAPPGLEAPVKVKVDVLGQATVIDRD